MGRTHSLEIAILAAWIAATLFMWVAATKSFSTVDRVLRTPNPQFAEAVKTMGPDLARMVLRYLASEINRTFFWFYGGAQIIIGGLLVFWLWRQTPRDSLAVAIVGAMLGLVLVLTFIVTPLMISTGRAIDFIPRNPPPPAMPRFWILHGAFTGLDGVKLLAGLTLLFRWILAR
jgi:hypothetical protein